MMTDALPSPLLERIRELVREARGRAVRAVNQAMVELYWEIGRTIVEDEQGGTARAAYGEAVIDILMRVDGESARTWYMNEAADAGWSVRDLERQIGSHYYERLLASRDRGPVLAEAAATGAILEVQPAAEIKDPYVFEFLGLPGGHLLERDLEAALLDNLQAFLGLGRPCLPPGRLRRNRRRTGRGTGRGRMRSHWCFKPSQKHLTPAFGRVGCK